MASQRTTVKTLDFLCIGAGKSGTTSLFHYLRHHPRIYLPPGKELPFFTSEEWWQRGWEAFAAFHYRDASPDALWGKITPQYMGDPRIPERIHRIMPRVKLIALLRNPIEGAFSYYRMLVRAGDETRSFDEAVTAQLAPDILQRARARPRTLPRTQTYIARREYGRILADYLNYFDREQFLLLFTDELASHPHAVIRRILEFIGLPTDYTPPNLGKHYFQGGTQKRFPGLKPFLRRQAPLRWLWHRFPLSWRYEIHQWYEAEINVKRMSKSPKEVLAPDTHALLVEFYRPDIHRLEELFGIQTPWPEFQSPICGKPVNPSRSSE